MIPELIVTAPNGVVWKRLPDGTSTAEEFLAALEALLTRCDDVEQQWNWWQDGRAEQEREKINKVVDQWNHAAPPPGGYKYESIDDWNAEFDARQARRDEERAARAASFDEERCEARLLLLQAEPTTAFMHNVLNAPASPAQRAKAEELRNASEQEAATLRLQVGDPDEVVDRHGDLPATRHKRHVKDHMTYFRHHLLREWSATQKQRFKRLLAMPALRPDEMCSECQAPTIWHSYAISLCLWRSEPKPGTNAATIARLMPGVWQRCWACTPYQLSHQWGHSDALPDFNGEQWQKMLTPLLRAIFAPDKPAPRKPPDKRAALQRRLQAAETEAEKLRNKLAELETNNDDLDNH